MAIPTYGAKPIALTFLGCRAFQLTFLIVIIGMAANFINAMVMDNHDPSREIVGALVITSIATLYTLVSISFFWAQAQMGMFVMAAVDFLIFIAFIVVSVTVGKPVASLNCYWRFENMDGEVLTGLQEVWNEKGSTVNLQFWSGMNKSNCFETKAIWGFCIALTILYSVTAILLPTLHMKNKKTGGFVKADV
jgi:hypothetical protein